MKKLLIISSLAFFIFSCSKEQSGVIINSSVKDEAKAFNSMSRDPIGVRIGTQVWMRKNLNVTTFRNGDTIPSIGQSSRWGLRKIPARCYINNEPKTADIYGKLYNWFAVNDPRGLAPVGWRIPTISDYKILFLYLGGAELAGGTMKSLSYWAEPNTGATDSVGFSALPAGHRYSGGQFYGLGRFGCFWTLSTNGYESAKASKLYFDDVRSDFVDFNKKAGLSVRCIKE